MKVFKQMQCYKSEDKCKARTYHASAGKKKASPRKGEFEKYY